MSSIYGNKIEIATLVVKLSSRCNMNCDYCYIYNAKDTSWKDMPKSIPRDITNLLSVRIAELYENQQIKPSIVFHGGEPLLAGINNLRDITKSIINKVPNANINIQSNGTIYNKNLESFLTEYRENVSFSLSVDGFKSENDLHRLGLKNKSVYEKIEATINLSIQAELLSSILLVIDVKNNPEKIYSFMRFFEVRQFNIILPDGDYNTLPNNKKSKESIEMGQWLWELFKLYATSESKFQIKFFDDIAKGILRNKTHKKIHNSTFSLCTMTIDTDGSIKQSDTFRINGDRADNIGDFNILKDSLIDVMNSEENVNYMKNIEILPSTCLECNYLNICGGGYPSHRLKKESFINPSIYCSDYKYLFKKMEAAICK